MIGEMLHCSNLPIEQLAYFPTISEYAAMYWPLYSIVGIGVPMGLCLLFARIRSL